MKTVAHFPSQNKDQLFDQLLALSENYSSCCFLNSLNYSEDKFGKYDWIIALDVVDSLSIFPNTISTLASINQFIKEHNGSWKFAYWSYDLKNHIEALHSENEDYLDFADSYIFVPKFVALATEVGIEILCHPSTVEAEISDFKTSIKLPLVNMQAMHQPLELKQRISKSTYLNQVDRLKQHIKLGDIYEVNFCQEFYAENQLICPWQTFKKLNQFSPAPFSSFFKEYHRYLLSASPERYIQRCGNKIISQPIKGTSKRQSNEKLDQEAIYQLNTSEKERAENIMIVDLVRNDLSKIKGAKEVKVAELCGIYSFEYVHQMISTISAQIPENTDIIDILKATFPMGSMTGAPKISAMKLIEEYEQTKRGLFSGSVGYIEPNGDFDFNVIIRSLQYNSRNKYLSLMTGGAITYKSNAEDEYNESLLKAESIIKALQ